MLDEHTHMNLRAMRIYPVTVILSAFILLALSGCGSGQQNSTASTASSTATAPSPAPTTSTSTNGAGSTVTVTEANNGQLVELEPGGILKVTLKSNPSTGYRWKVTSLDATVLGQEGEPAYVPDPGSEGLVGAGGTETFTFRSLRPGQTSLVMEYISPSGQPSGTAFRVTVKTE